MSPVFRSLALMGLVTCMMGGFMPATAQAATRHHHHHVVKKSHHKKKTRHSRATTNVRTAQTDLSNLGYYKGKIDGLMGPMTRMAIRNFQREHRMKVDGVLTVATYNAIVVADSKKAMAALPAGGETTTLTPATPPAPDFYATHPDFYGYYDQQYENAGLLGFPQNVTSRFAKIELSENMSGAMKRYDVSVNGEAILKTGDQPSIIGISNTYSIGFEDLIILTSYDDSNPVCVYAHHLLVLHDGGNHMLDIQNCTRGYQAKVEGDSLFITFPEVDDKRDVGATWRYEKGDLQRL